MNSCSSFIYFCSTKRRHVSLSSAFFHLIHRDWSPSIPAKRLLGCASPASSKTPCRATKKTIHCLSHARSAPCLSANSLRRPAQNSSPTACSRIHRESRRRLHSRTKMRSANRDAPSVPRSPHTCQGGQAAQRASLRNYTMPPHAESGTNSLHQSYKGH